MGLARQLLFVLSVALLTIACGSGRSGAIHPAARVAPVDDVHIKVARESARLFDPARDAELGRTLGRYQMTYYHVAAERGDTPTRTLRDASCKPIAKVSRAFARRLQMEGTGRLRDGRLLNIAGNCKCPGTCYFDASARGMAWGVGVRNRPLTPFRSIAVDPRHIPIGTWVYVQELDGLRMPGNGNHGDFVHDGCVRADDRGGGILGKQIDFFAGLGRYYRALRDRRITRVTVHMGGKHCMRHEAEATASVSTATSTDG